MENKIKKEAWKGTKKGPQWDLTTLLSDLQSKTLYHLKRHDCPRHGNLPMMLSAMSERWSRLRQSILTHRNSLRSFQSTAIATVVAPAPGWWTSLFRFTIEFLPPGFRTWNISSSCNFWTIPGSKSRIVCYPIQYGESFARSKTHNWSGCRWRQWFFMKGHSQPLFIYFWHFYCTIGR